MISEYEEMEISFLKQSKNLNRYKKLIKSLDQDQLANELEVLEWQIRECTPDKEEALETLKDIVSARIEEIKNEVSE